MTKLDTNWGKHRVILEWVTATELPNHLLRDVTSVHGFCVDGDDIMMVNLDSRGAIPAAAPDTPSVTARPAANARGTGLFMGARVPLLCRGPEFFLVVLVLMKVFPFLVGLTNSSRS